MEYVLSRYTQTNEARVIKGKIIEKMNKGKKNSHRVIVCKITLNVWSKSRGNPFWFELARTSSYRGFELQGVNFYFMLVHEMLMYYACHKRGRWVRLHCSRPSAHWLDARTRELHGYS